MFSNALEFAPEHDAEFFEAIPSAPAVFLLAGEEGAEPYVSKTANLKRRLVRLLGVPDERTRRLNLRERVRRIEYTRTGSDFESTFLLYQALRRAFPKTYRDRLRLRLAPLIKFNVDNPYPRAYVTQRITASEKSVYYGPFPTRAAAEQFLNDSLDLFKIRRCDFEIHPDPKYPGCIYSEMKMCLAPCFAGCTDEEYQRETARVREFFDSAGQSLVKELTAERERASEALEFESAAALHARIEKITAAARLPEIVRRLDRLAGIMVQPAAEEGTVALFRVDAGCIYGPMAFAVQQAAGKPLSMEARIEEMLGAPENQPKGSSNTQRMEHLAILKRWYFRSSKTGEIFFTDDNGELPLRRIVRGVSRVFRGEKAESDPMHTAAREYWLARTRAPEAPPES